MNTLCYGILLSMIVAIPNIRGAGAAQAAVAHTAPVRRALHIGLNETNDALLYTLFDVVENAASGDTKLRQSAPSFDNLPPKEQLFILKSNRPHLARTVQSSREEEKGEATTILKLLDQQIKILETVIKK